MNVCFLQWLPSYGDCVLALRVCLVLFILMLSPVCADTKFSRSVLSCTSSRLCDKRARSSAHPNRPAAPKGTLDSISSVFVWSFSSSSLWHSCHPSSSYSFLYLEGLSKSARMSNLTCHPIICVAYQCYNCLWYTVVSKELPRS